MASAFSHALVAVTLGKIYTAEKMPWRFWFLSTACAILPDADVLGFAFGISYSDLWGHRGLSHSLFFALIVGLLVVQWAFRDIVRFSKPWWTLVLYFSLVTASHGFLDAMTTGGLGIAFFAPFDPTRYFLPWRPVKVSPISLSAFFSPWGMQVIISEIKWIWLPSLLFFVTVKIGRKIGQARKVPHSA
jgi:inner membrane protein